MQQGPEDDELAAHAGGALLAPLPKGVLAAMRRLCCSLTANYWSSGARGLRE